MDTDPIEWQFRVNRAPNYAGAYWIGGVNVGAAIRLTRRPRWWQRAMMAFVFGWEWDDEKPAH